MKRFHFINLLPLDLKKIYYNAITSDQSMTNDQWSEITSYIESYKNTSISEEEITTLMKYLSTQDKELLNYFIIKNNKYNYLIKNNIFTFEEIIKVEETVIENVLKGYSMEKIVKACMAASPSEVSFIKSYVDNIEFNNVYSGIGSVSIDEITSIHDSIIKQINLQI